MSNAQAPGGLLRKLLSPLMPSATTAKSDDALPQAAYKSVVLLSEMMREKSRLGELRDAELEREAKLRIEIARIDGERIEAITEFRAHGDKGHQERANALLTEAAALRQEADDAEGVANGLQSKIDGMNPEFEALQRQYRVDLGVFLDTVYRRLANRYMELAPEVADVVLQIAGLQNVMMQYLAGNTNGFERRVYLPRIAPGQGNALMPLLDADTRQFGDGARARTDAILDELKAAGFVWRFK
jgi:hypothetical protein